MKKYLLIIIPLFLILLCSCSSVEQQLDRYYERKTEVENRLSESGVSEKEKEYLIKTLEGLNDSISDLRRNYAVTVSPDSLDIESIPYVSEDADKIGEWFYNNIVYPLYCYEIDYPYLEVNSDENFTSQEKFYIICYYLMQEYSDLITEKYAYLDLNADVADKLALEYFGETINRSAVAEFSLKTNSYSIPVPRNDDRLLIPILTRVRVKDVTKTEITVSYAEKTLSRSIYSETFVFERSGEKGFFLFSRTRSNQSSSLINTGASVVSEDEIFILDPAVIIPEKINDGSVNISQQMSQYYCEPLSYYSGAVVAYESLDVSSVLNMLLLIQPDIKELIAKYSEDYSYFGLKGDYIKEQILYFFGNDAYLDNTANDYYNEPLDVYIYKISDISSISYNRQTLSVTELDNEYVRIETAIFEPMSYTSLVAKEVIILKDIGDGYYSVFSRHYNVHTSSFINSVMADIVPKYPDVYPSTSSSDIVKGKWLYENYGSLIDFEFDSVNKISSEKLAIFAIERLFSTDEFKKTESVSSNYGFPAALIEEEIRLYFGNTDFVSEHVSFYDILTGCFYVNFWSSTKKDTSGTVIRSGSSNGYYTVYIDVLNADISKHDEYVLTFSEAENGSFKFVSAYIIH